jgi:hypothetical protein
VRDRKRKGDFKYAANDCVLTFPVRSTPRVPWHIVKCKTNGTVNDFRRFFANFSVIAAFLLRKTIILSAFLALF